MFENTNNNGRQYGNSVNVNTRLYTSYSDTAQIVLGAWNNNISIKVHPFQGLNAEGLRQYAQDSTQIINVVITNDNAHALIEAANKVLYPAINNNSEASIAVYTGSGDTKKSLTLHTDGNDVFLTVALGVNDEGVAPESNIITHKFNKRKYIVGYNPAVGGGDTVEANSDFESFMNKIRSIDNFSGAIAHGINYNSMIKKSFSSNNSNSYSHPAPNYSAPSTNYGNAGDLSDFLPGN